MRQTRGSASHWSETPLVKFIGPMQVFIKQSESSGILLLIVTIIALAIANSPLAPSYEAILKTPVSLAVGSFVIQETVIHWINDGLMVIFFFVVGLEIKREVLVGELADLQKAIFPIVAAIGGSIVPALIYIAFNMHEGVIQGWGVPIATDIAFALGCLALLKNRIPFSLKIFLTAVAIADDLIAVLIIAIFYSEGLNFSALGVGVGLLFLLLLVNLSGIRTPLIYAVVGIIVWLAFLQSGVHTTVAGVLLAMTIPARNQIDTPTFLDRARGILQQFEQSDHAAKPMLIDEIQQSAVRELEDICEQVQAPLQRMEHFLHGWVSLLIIPVFAFTNAGVALSAVNLNDVTHPVFLGIALGLTLGKPIGLLSACWLAIRIGIANLPQAVTWTHLVGVSFLAGIGFTMSLFIASLGFSDPATLTTAKIAILSASMIAGIIGLALLWRIPAEQQ